MTSSDWVVVRETLHAVTYPQPVEAEPSTVMSAVETAGFMASTMTAKSLVCGVPKDSVVRAPLVDEVETVDELELVIEELVVVELELTVLVEELIVVEEVVAVVEEVVAVVEEVDDHTGVPPGSEDTEPPITIASFCKTEFCRAPCTPYAEP
jgi:hypothetical protein